MSPQILEASMLILFGCSWPVNIAKSVRAGTARGKSILYELIVLTDVALTLRNRYLDRLADERMRREHA